MSVPVASKQTGLSGFRDTLRRDWMLALAVVAVALLVRIVVLAQIRQTIFGQYVTMDARGYQAWSLDIARGDWLGAKVFYQEPLYPYLLALIHLVCGPGLLPIFIVQIVVGSVNCALVQILAARVTQHRWAGLAAGLILAFYHTMVFYEVQVLKPVWVVLILLLLTHLLISAWERRRAWTWLVAGVLMAFLGLLRGNTLVYAPFVMLWIGLACRAQGRARVCQTLGLFAAGLAAPLLAVMLRNAVVGGDFVLSSSHAGFNFYIGNNDEADGGYSPVRGVQEDPRFEGEDARRVAGYMAGHELKPSEASAWWFSQATRFIREHPLRWLRLLGLKVARFFNADEVPDTWSPDFFEQNAPRLRFAFLTYAMLMPAAVVGLVVLWRLGPCARLIHALVLATVVSVVIFYVFGRYRMPVVPFFAVSAAYAGADLVRRLRARAWGASGLMLVGAAVAAALALAPLPSRQKPGESTGVQHFNLGLIYFEQLKDDARARVEWEQALKLFPTHSGAMSALAWAYLSESETEKARAMLFDAIRADDLNADAHFLLAGIYYRERKPLNATVEMERAVSARPGFLDAWQNLGKMRIEQRDFAAGARDLERAAGIFPDAEIVWLDLGTCYYGLKDAIRARAAWTRARELASTPENKRRAEDNLRMLAPKGTP